MWVTDAFTKELLKIQKACFQKRKGKKKYQMTEECNCLPLKYILNSSTENLLEHFVFVQVVTKLDQNDTCLGRLLNISEALKHVVSHLHEKSVQWLCICFYIWTLPAFMRRGGAHHVENTVVIFVYYSWNNVHLPLKQIHATWFWVSHCFWIEKNCYHLCWGIVEAWVAIYHPCPLLWAHILIPGM